QNTSGRADDDVVKLSTCEGAVSWKVHDSRSKISVPERLPLLTQRREGSKGAKIDLRRLRLLAQRESTDFQPPIKPAAKPTIDLGAGGRSPLYRSSRVMNEPLSATLNSGRL